MGKEIKAAVIAGILGIVGTVSAAVIGAKYGESTEQKNIQNKINEVMGDMVNVIGDGNEVIINDRMCNRGCHYRNLFRYNSI